MRRLILTTLLMFVILISGCIQQENGLEPTEKSECIYSNTYSVKLIMPMAFGLPAQFALLPNSDIVIADSSNERILLLSNGTIETIVSGDISGWAVAALPDSRIAYAKKNNELMLFDYKTKQEKSLGKLPSTYYPGALAADKDGNVYVGTLHNGLFFFKNNKLETLAKDLPFPDPGFLTITDLAIGTDGTVYVAGFEKVVAVNSNGIVQTIADGLNYEPVWVEVGPDGMAYINDVSHGLQKFDPKTKQLSQPKVRYGFGDMLALTANELFFFDYRGAFYTLNLKTNKTVLRYVNSGNDFAFAVGNNTVFFATPPLESVLKQHIVQLHSNGTHIDLHNLEYATIFSADVDDENRLNLLTDEGIVRINHNGSIVKIPLHSEGIDVPDAKNFATGRDSWYMIATDHNENIRVFSIDGLGKIKALPISFTRDSFGAYKVDDARIDVAADGSLAMIVTARGSVAQGPYLQRVYRANSDGSNLTEIARLDSHRIAGMVDIAVGPENNVFVLSPQGKTGGPDSIYRIDSNGRVSETVHICAGRDPKSIDVDSAGNIWFSSTLGIFKAEHAQ